MKLTPLPRRHPKTGAPLEPIFHTKDGTPRYPILGASEDDPSNGGDGDGSGDDDGGDDGEDGAQPIFTREDMTKRLTREKDQGKRALARELGFDSVKELQDHLAALKEAEDKQLTEVERRERAAQEREAAAQRQAAETARERREASLERALIRRGVSDADLEDATALLERALDADADADAIAAAADELKGRRKELFGSSASEEESAARPGRGRFPGGDGKPKGRNTSPGKDPGAYGRQRAEKRWGTAG